MLILHTQNIFSSSMLEISNLINRWKKPKTVRSFPLGRSILNGNISVFWPNNFKLQISSFSVQRHSFAQAPGLPAWASLPGRVPSGDYISPNASVAMCAPRWASLRGFGRGSSLLHCGWCSLPRSPASEGAGCCHAELLHGGTAR